MNRNRMKHIVTLSLAFIILSCSSFKSSGYVSAAAEEYDDERVPYYYIQGNDSFVYFTNDNYLQKLYDRCYKDSIKEYEIFLRQIQHIDNSKELSIRYFNPSTQDSATFKYYYSRFQPVSIIVADYASLNINQFMKKYLEQHNDTFFFRGRCTKEQRLTIAYCLRDQHLYYGFGGCFGAEYFIKTGTQIESTANQGKNHRGRSH